MTNKLFIETTNGTKSPDDVAKALRKYGTLIAIKPDTYLNGQRKYYTIEHFDDDRIAEVLIINGKAVYVQYLPASAKKALLRNTTDVLSDQIQFGNF